MPINKFGWIPFHNRTGTMMAHHRAVRQSIIKDRPKFFNRTAETDPGPMAGPLSYWTSQAVKDAIGFEYPGIHQITGSCVGAGGGNTLFSLLAEQVISGGLRSKIVVPFWLFTYGMSRKVLGETSEGEGSTGSAFVQAATEYGEIDQANTTLTLPKFDNSDGLVWGESNEMHWSDGTKIGQEYLSEGSHHLVKTVAQMSGSSDCRGVLRGMQPCTIATNWFSTPGNERLMGSGANQVIVGDLDGNGGHQTSLQLVFDHPELGPIFWNNNQWGRNVYKKDPLTGRADGVWMLAKTIDKACRGDGEVYGWSSYAEGFPIGMVPWENLIPIVSK